MRNEFKGTPGPWEKHVRKGKILAIIPTYYGERRLENILQTGTIHDDDCGNETCCCVEEHANARLISAAPDLLNACISLMDCYENKGQLLSFDVDIIRQAINKALNITSNN